MTTEDLIELLRQYPMEEVAVAVHVRDQTAFCEIGGVVRYGGARPRLKICTELELVIDQDELSRAAMSAVLVKGEHGGSH